MHRVSILILSVVCLAGCAAPQKEKETLELEFPPVEYLERGNDAEGAEGAEERAGRMPAVPGSGKLFLKNSD